MGARGAHSKKVSMELSADGEASISMEDDLMRITHGAVTGGPFVVGETITGGTSSATGTVARVESDGLVYTPGTGTLQNAEVLTGGTSSATATSNAAPAVAEHRFALTIQTTHAVTPIKGVIDTVTLVCTAKAGTAFTGPFTVEILNTDSLIVSLNSVNTIYRRSGIAVPGTPPDPIIFNETIIGNFRCAGTAGKLSIAILRTGGGDADSDWTFTVKLNGEERI